MSEISEHASSLPRYVLFLQIAFKISMYNKLNKKWQWYDVFNKPSTTNHLPTQKVGKTVSDWADNRITLVMELIELDCCARLRIHSQESVGLESWNQCLMLNYTKTLDFDIRCRLLCMFVGTQCRVFDPFSVINIQTDIKMTKSKSQLPKNWSPMWPGYQ